MSKAAVIPELVEWTTFSDGKENACVGCFSDNASRDTILNEIADAPVDIEDLSSRTALYRSKKPIESNPLNKGYSETNIIILTNKDLDPLDISNLPYELDVDAMKKFQDDKIEFNGKTYKYRYQFKVNISEQVA